MQRLLMRQWRKNWRLKFAMAINVALPLEQASKAVDIDATTAMLPAEILCELYRLSGGVQPGLC